MKRHDQRVILWLGMMADFMLLSGMRGRVEVALLQEDKKP